MAKKLYTVTDLGGGDGGKGGVVHKISSMTGAHTVLKVGGAQGSHGVRTAAGQYFNFSHFGCGTFEGARTHITDLMVIDPYRFVKEGEQLVNEWRIRNAFDLITVDENALVITPYHTFASRLKELARKGNPRGTVGTGGGTAFEDSLLDPNSALRVGYIKEQYLGGFLECIRQKKFEEVAEPLLGKIKDLLPEDQAHARELITMMTDQNMVSQIFQVFRNFASRIKIVDKDYLKKKILGRDGAIVVESSHGILTDRYYGFHPHTTKLRTILQPTLDLLRECEYDGEVKKVGVTRAYQIRHGAGPMVTESPELLGELLPGSHKEDNRWQGKVRVGALDLVALRYAIGVCGGPETFDGLAITWFDQVMEAGKWNLCDKYTGADDAEFFTQSGEIKINRSADEAQLKHQEELGKALNGCNPQLFSHDIGQGTSEDNASELCSNVLQDTLGVPVRMISFGPTEKDKVLL